MRESSIESICIFGSVARESADEHSDRDVLVVAESPHRRKELGNCWKEKGWSVASFSPRRFQRMVDKGSLFVQHLKLESRMVEDEAGWLAETLERAVPKKSYEFDAMASVNLARPIERFNPGLQLSEVPLSADLAYVAVRNFGICYLADRDRLSFDYSRIVDLLGKEFCLSSVETELLLSLRAAKSCYRKEGACAQSSLGSVGALSSILSKFFLRKPLHAIDPRSPVRDLGCGYSTLRDFEASVIARLGRLPSESDIQSMGLETIWRWVTQPREYTWQVRNFAALELGKGIEGSVFR